MSGIYIAFSKAQNRAQASQKLLNDSQYVLEIMAREIRSNAIYSFDPSNNGTCDSILDSNNTDCIILVHEDETLVAFSRDELYSGRLYYITPTDCTLDDTTCTWGLDTTYTRLLSGGLNNIIVNKLKFIITPSTDPYTVDRTYTPVNQHPVVTIVMETEYVGSKDEEKVKYTLQTSVSSRIYRR